MLKETRSYQKLGNERKSLRKLFKNKLKLELYLRKHQQDGRVNALNKQILPNEIICMCKPQSRIYIEQAVLKTELETLQRK